ncbi:MAG: AAA family ATPase, partial [Thermoplasmata archaeon]
MPSDLVPTGVPGLDRILGGGLEADALTEFYGEGGSGKTVACLQATVRVTEQPAWVVYVDTEGVSAARLEAISGARRDEVLARLLLATPKDLRQQTRAVRSACILARSDARRVGLIVLDSATLYYRLAVGEDNDESGRAELARQLADLLATSL